MSTQTTPRFDLPTPDEHSQVFWDAARAGKLLIGRCESCAMAHYYPRPFCPHCGWPSVVWEEASGAGSLYTWSVVHQNDLPPFGERVPYVAAIVDLAEGPRMMTNVIDCAFEDLAAGMALQVAFQDIGEGFTIPVFRPAVQAA